MQEQNNQGITNKQSNNVQIKILGSFSHHFKVRLPHEPFDTIQFSSQAITMRSYRPQMGSTTIQAYDITPKRIWSQGNLISIVDQYENMWIISDTFPNYVNVSTLLYRKVKNVFLSENQCIISNKKKPILLNWGAKKVIDIKNLQNIKINERQLQFIQPKTKNHISSIKKVKSKMNNQLNKKIQEKSRQSIRKNCSQPKLQKSVGGYFKAYFIDTAQKNDKFYYSNQRKVQNANKLYQISDLTQSYPQNQNAIQDKRVLTQINCYPTGDIIGMKKKINGISVGKFHCMAWDEHGSLYTWGNRTIALGFKKLPRDKVITKPHKLSQFSNGPIKSAFAGTHYSLALCTDGTLYHWGIKKQANQLNEQLIFEPTPVKFPEASEHIHIIMLRGKLDNYACLSSSGDLYVWGHKAANFIPEFTANTSRNLIEDNKNINSQQKYLKDVIISTQIYQPLKVPYLKQFKIIDFSVDENFIAIITTGNSNNIMIDEQKEYWESMINRVKDKLSDSPKKKLKNMKIKTQSSEIGKHNKINLQKLSVKRYFSSTDQKKEDTQQKIEPFNFATAEPYQINRGIQKAYYHRQIKRQYFKSLKNQNKFFKDICYHKQIDLEIDQKFHKRISSFNYQQIFKNISKNNQRKLSNQQQIITEKKGSIKQNQYNNSLTQQQQQPRPQSKQARYSRTLDLKNTCKSTKNSNFNNLSNTTRYFNRKSLNSEGKLIKTSVRDAKQYINNFFTENRKNRQKQNTKVFQMTVRNAKNYQDMMQKIRRSKMSKQNYTIRLRKVIERKKSIQENNMNEIVKKVQENSVQYRAQKHQQILKSKIHQKNRNLLQMTLQTFLIKKYLIRAYTAVIQPARKIKIQRFGRNVRLARIQRNIRKIFINAKVSQGIKKLSRCNIFTYAKLCAVFKQYVKRWRQNKIRKNKKIIAQQIYKTVLKQKIKFGISKAHLTVRKLQKLRQWMIMTQIQRTKCLKFLWRNHLLSIMKVSNQSDAVGILKQNQECTFESLYQQKIAINPLLKLQNYLNKTPIFSLRHQYFQSIIFLFKKQNTRGKSQKSCKKIMRKQRIKFSGEGISISPYSALQSNDLLPYSLHYNLFIRKKNLDLNLSQNIRKSEKWMLEQRKVFEQCLLDIIRKHDRQFIRKKRKYDVELAIFIKQKFQSLSEKRWKCILQYNQLKITPEKIKKQRQLTRLFDLIGMRKTLLEDCLPEKYLILDEAIKRRDSPPAPQSYINFGLNEFKHIFTTKYFDVLASRAKIFRKNYI